MKQNIEKKLTQKFSPTFLEVINNSHLHSGHFEARDEDMQNQTHFLIKISSDNFKNCTKINIHRQINEVLKDEFKRGLHALEIKVL